MPAPQMPTPSPSGPGMIETLGPSLVAGGLSLAGGALGNRASAAEAERNRKFQERMRSTQWQTTVADLKAAGLNPAIAYSQGSAGTPGGSMASQNDVITPAVSSAMQAKRMGADLKLIKEQIEKVKEERRGAAALANTTEARLRAYGITYKNGRLHIQMPGGAEGLPRMTREIEAGIQLNSARARREGLTSDTLVPLADLAKQMGTLLPILGLASSFNPTNLFKGRRLPFKRK